MWDFNLRNVLFKRKFIADSKVITRLRRLRLRTTGQSIVRVGGKGLDLVAVELFGQGNETYWYKIADANADRIIGWKGELDNIGKWRIPPQR